MTNNYRFLTNRVINRRFFLISLTSFAASTVFTSCAVRENNSANNTATEEKWKIKVGVSPVPAGEILKFVKDNLALDAGLDIEIITFSDGVQNNNALRDGQIDANYFQHIPYMQDFGNLNNFQMYAFTPQIHFNPVGLFSKKHKSLNELPDKALAVIPDEVNNAHRTLKLMEETGLIKLKPNVQLASPKDVVENFKNLQIKEISGAQAVLALPDVDLAGIVSTWVLLAGMKPNRDALVLESNQNPLYAVTLTTLLGKENDPKIKKLYQLLSNPKVKDFIKDKYQGAVIPIT